MQLQVAMQEEAINDAILREREEEIRAINTDVHKVNEIFRDLAVLVDKQQGDVAQTGELVERSHAHAEKPAERSRRVSIGLLTSWKSLLRRRAVRLVLRL